MKTAIYTRVSKTDGSQDVARQVADLREFAKSQNWEIVFEVEEKISGRRTVRSGTQKLINLARSNQIQKVLIHEISRLGRNVWMSTIPLKNLLKTRFPFMILTKGRKPLI
jgi:DNA invertase Pin-like site-specific DNA recombinase